MMNYKETLDYIQNVKWQGSKPGLSRTQELLAALGNPEKKLKFVHIAGTNGKGSTAACVASILQHAGYKTGLYTSPYILRFNERMQVNGEYISDDELIELTAKIRPFADTMEDVPTEFEVITALAMEYFLYKKTDIVVLEVGLGGEMDSTNVIDVPEVAVITAIGFDHVNVLGNTLPEIARTKAGIIKEGGDVVTYGGDAEVEAVFENVCMEKHATLYKADFSRLNIHGFDLDSSRFDCVPYKNIKLPLVGTYQPRNAAVAVTAVECLKNKGYKITDEDIIEGLNTVKWPGRFEILRREPVFVLDGAHNPHGIVATTESLKVHFKNKKLVFLLGVMADKDVAGMMDNIAPLAECFFTVEPPNPRAMAAGELAELLSSRYGLPVTACAEIPEAVEKAIAHAGKDGIVCALGSLYFSGEIREAVKSLGDSK